MIAGAELAGPSAGQAVGSSLLYLYLAPAGPGGGAGAAAGLGSGKSSCPALLAGRSLSIVPSSFFTQSYVGTMEEGRFS